MGREIYDFIVIGGGSAGLVAASGAALLGAKVALIEKKALGGDCLYSGCVPSKTLIRSARFASDVKRAKSFGFEPFDAKFAGNSFDSITNRIDRVIKIIEHHDAPERFEKMGVEVIFGSPRFISPHEVEIVMNDDPARRRVLKARRFCIATGSSAFVPPLEGLSEAGFLTNESIFHLSVLPPKLLILGGGAIGVEMAQSFARLGSEITQIEKGTRVLAREEPEASDFLAAVFAAEGIKILTGAQALRVRVVNGKKIVDFEADGRTFEIEADEILVATGRKPNTHGLDLDTAGVKFDRRKIETDQYLRTSAKHIFAAGDVTGNFQFTHMADYEAQVVIRNAFLFAPFRQKLDFSVVPWATFTEPEIARVGLTEAEAAKKFGAEKIKIYRGDFAFNDRANAEEEAHGFAKIVCRGRQIVGATIVSASAGDLIHEFVLAMRHNLTIAQLNQAIHIYPTLSKITQQIGTEQTIQSLQSPFVQTWFARYLKIWRKL